MTMTDITWTNETRKLRDLVPWPRNPRQIRQDKAKRLNKSLDDFGQVDIIAIGPNNEVYNGHQRLRVWMDKYGPNLEVDVRVASRPLTEKERERLTVLLHQGAVGEWDFDKLANEFNVDELLDWGFSEKELDVLGWKDTQDDPGDQKPELTISPELYERHDYLVFYFDNEFDWQVATELFGVEQVQGGKVGNKTIVQKGLGRVIPASKLLELLDD